MIEKVVFASIRTVSQQAWKIDWKQQLLTISPQDRTLDGR